MKNANRKILIRIFIVLICSTLVLSLLSFFVFDNGINVHKNKRLYKKTGEVEYLYDLCSDLILTSRYGDVIKYYPELLKHESFGELIANDDENETYFNQGFSAEDVKSVYVVTYLNAHLEKYGEENFDNEFNKYSDMLSFHITDNEEVLVFSTVLLYSYRLQNLKIEWFKVEKTEIFLNTLEEYVSTAELTKEQREISAVFIREMRFLINTYDKERIDELVVQYKDWDLTLNSLNENNDKFYSLPFGFVLVEDPVYGGYFCGDKSWRNSVVVYVESNVTACKYNDKYICLEQTLENSTKSYYIIDSEVNEIYGSYTFDEYNLKIEELAIGDLKSAEIINHQSDTIQSGDETITGRLA